MALQILFPEKKQLPIIPKRLFSQFPNIVSDPGIHSGWPHIKGTRILAPDIFRAQVQGYSLDKMIMEFSEMGVKITEKQLE